MSAIDQLLGDGYPDKSSILVVGPPGIGKEALCYWFAHSGLSEGDFCCYISRRSVRDILRDAQAFGIDGLQNIPFWLAGEGAQMRFNVNDLTSLSFNIKDVVKKNFGRRIRVIVDVLSPLLMLNPPDTIYRFLAQLFDEVKQYDALLLATLEEGMHSSQVVTAMEQLFDGVLELKCYEEGLRVVPLFRIRKMAGSTPQLSYFNFSLSRKGMEVSPYGK